MLVRPQSAQCKRGDGWPLDEISAWDMKEFAWEPAIPPIQPAAKHGFLNCIGMLHLLNQEAHVKGFC